MTLMATACPACGSEIEKGDRFCQECGLNLVQPQAVASSSLNSPLLGRRTLPKMLSEATVQSPEARRSPFRFWKAIPLAFCAELLLVTAMLGYGGSAILWLDKTQPDFVKISHHRDAAHKAKASLENRTTLSLCPQTNESADVRQLISRAQATVRAHEMAIWRATISGASSTVPVAVQLQSKTIRAESTATRAATPVALACKPPVVEKHKQTKPQEDSGQISSVAEYNRLLADYFSRKQSANGQGAEVDPPSFQEWIDANRPVF